MTPHARTPGDEVEVARQDFSPPALIRAIEDNFVESWALFARIGNGQFHSDEEIAWLSTEIPRMPYNGVLRACWPDGDCTARIRGMVEHFKTRQSEMIWMVGPSTRPLDLGQQLVGQGFTLVVELSGMAADLDQLPGEIRLPPETNLIMVNDPDSLHHFVDMVTRRWHLPEPYNAVFLGWAKKLGFKPGQPRQAWLAYQRGVPVAKGFMSLAAGVAGLYGVDVVPEARRQGLGAAITVAAYRWARAQGYRIGILHSTEMAVNLYGRLGFQPYGMFRAYVLN